MAYLFCLFDAQRGFLEDEAGRMNGDRQEGGRGMTRLPAMRLRVVSIRAVSRNGRGSGSGCLYVATLFIYLFERGETRRLTQTFVSKKRKFTIN